MGWQNLCLGVPSASFYAVFSLVAPLKAGGCQAPVSEQLLLAGARAERRLFPRAAWGAACLYHQHNFFKVPRFDLMATDAVADMSSISGSVTPPPALRGQ